MCRILVDNDDGFALGTAAVQLLIDGWIAAGNEFYGFELLCEPSGGIGGFELAAAESVGRLPVAFAEIGDDFIGYQLSTGNIMLEGNFVDYEDNQADDHPNYH